MHGLETSPGEITRTSSAPLNLDVTQRLNLLHEFRDLSTELADSATSTPYATKTELTGIRTEPSKKGGPTKNVSFKIVSTPHEPPMTEIAISSDNLRQNSQKTYIHRPSSDVWEEWLPGRTAPYRTLGTSSLIVALEPQLPAGALEAVMDYRPEEGTEVALLLSSYLRKKARRRVDRTHYKGHDIQLGGTEYVNTREADFIIQSENNRVLRSLFVATTQNLVDYGPIRKTYGYEIVENSGVLKSASGSLEMRASDAVTQLRLNAFAERDTLRNDPYLGIQLGIEAVRRAYGLPDQYVS